MKPRNLYHFPVLPSDTWFQDVLWWHRSSWGLAHRRLCASGTHVALAVGRHSLLGRTGQWLSCKRWEGRSACLERGTGDGKDERNLLQFRAIFGANSLIFSVSAMVIGLF